MDSSDSSPVVSSISVSLSLYPITSHFVLGGDSSFSSISTDGSSRNTATTSSVGWYCCFLRYSTCVNFLDNICISCGFSIEESLMFSSMRVYIFISLLVVVGVSSVQQLVTETC